MPQGAHLRLEGNIHASSHGPRAACSARYGRESTPDRELSGYALYLWILLGILGAVLVVIAVAGRGWFRVGEPCTSILILSSPASK